MKKNLLLEAGPLAIAFALFDIGEALTIGVSYNAEIDKLKNDNRELYLFFKKYRPEIERGLVVVDKVFIDWATSQKLKFYEPSNIKKMSAHLADAEYIEDVNIEESLLIDREILKYNLKTFLLENSEKFKNLKTKDVNFSWGKYNPSSGGAAGRKIADSDYYIASGRNSLGDFQLDQDPFTYEKTSERTLTIVSAPESEKDSIGREIPYQEIDFDPVEGEGMAYYVDPEATRDPSESEDIQALDDSFKESFAIETKQEILDIYQTEKRWSGLGVISLEYGRGGWKKRSKPRRSNLDYFADKIAEAMTPYFTAVCQNRLGAVMLVLAGAIKNKCEIAGNYVSTGADETLSDISKFETAHRIKVGSHISDIGYDISESIKSKWTRIATSGRLNDRGWQDNLAAAMGFEEEDICGKSLTGERESEIEIAEPLPTIPRSDVGMIMLGRGKYSNLNAKERGRLASRVQRGEVVFYHDVDL